MAKCTSCGERTLDGRSICFYCEDPNPVVEARKPQVEKVVAEPDDEQIFNRVLSLVKKNLKAKLDKGQKIYIYQSLEISTPFTLDSNNYGSLDDSELIRAGLQGWQIKGFVPKTHGIRLENVNYQGFTSSNTWAGGVGGNIDGAFVIMCLELEDSSQLTSSTFRDWCRNLFDSGFDFEDL